MTDNQFSTYQVEQEMTQVKERAAKMEEVSHSKVAVTGIIDATAPPRT